MSVPTLDISRIFVGELKEIPFECRLPLDGLSDDILSGEATVNGVVADHSGYTELSASFTLEYKALCARCGKQYTAVHRFEILCPITEKLDNPSFDEETPAGDEFYIAPCGKLDLDDVCTSSIILNFPPRFLCSPDCKGLCPVCGADLNTAACSCGGKRIDPRLEKLKDYFKE